MPRYIGAYRGGVRPSAPTTVYRPCTLSLTCHSEGAKRPWESVPLFISTAALAATYLCRSAAKARFDNRQPPKGVSKEGGPQPSLFGRSRMGDFQGGRKIETSFPLEWRSLDTFFRQGKKVSRRRHPAPGRGTPLPFGKESNPPEATKKKEKERESRPQAALLPSIYITPPSRSVHSRRCCGDRPRRRCSSRCCGTRRTSAPADSSAKWPRRCSWV